MKLLYINLLLLMLLSNFAFSQQKGYNFWYKITIIDSLTLKGIDRATVSTGKKKIFITNATGIANIPDSLIQQADSSEVSSVGYKTVSFALLKGKLPETICLSPSVTVLSEVKVNGSKPEIRMGIIKKKYNAHYPTYPNCSYIQFIPNENKIKGTITTVEFVLNDFLKGIQYPFKLRLFTKSKTSITLDHELTKDSIIVYNPERKKQLTVNISRYGIQLPQEGIMVVFEILSPSFYGQGFVMFRGFKCCNTPGIDIELKNKGEYPLDIEKTEKKGPYAMVGPIADRWNLDGIRDQWFVFAEGNNFAVNITVSP